MAEQPFFCPVCEGRGKHPDCSVEAYVLVTCEHCNGTGQATAIERVEMRARRARMRAIWTDASIEKLADAICAEIRRS